MSNNLPDIRSREDLLYLLREFYGKAMEDDLLAEKFVNIQMEAHIPIIANFWHTVLFGSQSYMGDPFGKHIPLDLTAQHFERWLELFTETINDHFTGNIATEAITRATTIAQVFKHKLGI